MLSPPLNVMLTLFKTTYSLELFSSVPNKALETTMCDETVFWDLNYSLVYQEQHNQINPKNPYPPPQKKCYRSIYFFIFSDL